jgi:hypothetical protein
LRFVSLTHAAAGHSRGPSQAGAAALSWAQPAALVYDALGDSDMAKREGDSGQESVASRQHVQLRGPQAVQALAVGKRTRVESLVQQVPAPQGADGATASAGAGGGAAVHDAAAHGISGSSTALPYAGQIQRLFGSHDISNVEAHTDAAATAGAQAMGAQAYATGNHVAFASPPDLHTAAHEAAHVVQQRAGVHLKGGIGEAGDPYERNADAVADRVVRGESAEDLLPGPGSGGAAVQRRAGDDSAASGDAPVQKKEGKVTHQANVGSGQVTARENDFDPNDKTNDNYSLEYAGKDADNAHWLQFVNFSMVAEVPGTGKVYNTDTIGTSSGKKPFSTDKVTNWSVDSTSKSNPYYEAGFSNVRTPSKGTKVFDAPGGPSWASTFGEFVATKAAKATKVTFTAHFDTYLVVSGKATYHVTWSATTEYDPDKKTTAAIAYATGDAGDVKGLPKDLKTVLDTEYAGNKIT